MAAAAFSTVFVYNWQGDKQQLEQDCFYEGCILALYMKAKGDFVLVRQGWGLREQGRVCWYVAGGDTRAILACSWCTNCVIRCWSKVTS